VARLPVVVTRTGSGVRTANASRLVRELHTAGPLTRSELAARSGLNRSTVGGIVWELAAAGVVVESASAAPSGSGRPSHVVAFAEGRVWALAAELSPAAVTVARVEPGGHIVAKVRDERRRGGTDPAADAELIGRLSAEWGGELGTMVGAAVAVHGIVRRADGLVRLAPNLGWRDVAFGELLHAALGVEVRVANEADLGALAEHARGAALGADEVVYVSGDTGVGAGVLAGGRLLGGRSGYAGEVGHMVVDPGGRRCHCGGRGCWETEIGASALARRAGRRRVGVAAVVAAARAGDRTAIEAVGETGRWLGRGAASLVNVFDPELVVFGGALRELFVAAEATVRAELRRSALAASAADTELRPAALGGDSALLGAGELALEEFLADPAGVGAGSAQTVP